MGIGSPRLRRELAAAITLALSIPGAGHAVPLTPLERSFLEHVNAARTARGVAPVRVDSALQLAARRHTAAMLAGGSLSHGGWWQRLRRLGARGPWLGEDLGWYSDPASLSYGMVTTSRPSAFAPPVARRSATVRPDGRTDAHETRRHEGSAPLSLEAPQ